MGAEIGFRLLQADTLFKNLTELMSSTSGGAAGGSLQDKVKMVMDEVNEKLENSGAGDGIDLVDVLDRVSERTPYVNVFLQEIERMNILLKEIKRSLAEMDLGLRGDLQISDSMEALMKALAEDTVPSGWNRLAYPSERPLGSWFSNLVNRAKQLQDWSGDLGLPKSTWLPGLFNPQSFLTAVKQTTARRNDWALDKTTSSYDVTKKQVEDITAPSRDGAFIHGLILESARWDEKAGCVEDSRPRELFCIMPVIMVKAVTADSKRDSNRDQYECPVYKTQRRGATFVFSAGLRSKVPVSKWVLAGVGLLMEVV